MNRCEMERWKSEEVEESKGLRVKEWKNALTY